MDKNDTFDKLIYERTKHESEKPRKKIINLKAYIVIESRKNKQKNQLIMIYVI